jgi:hypothetical protein
MNTSNSILPAKKYRSHNCDGSHREYRTAARCIFPWAAYGIRGNGPYAIRHKSFVLGQGIIWSIQLYETPERASREFAEMRDMHYGGQCSGTCTGFYDLIILEPTVLEPGHRWESR